VLLATSSAAEDSTVVPCRNPRLSAWGGGWSQPTCRSRPTSRSCTFCCPRMGRVVIDGTRADQDLIVEKLRATFSTAPRPPKIIDRRAKPIQATGRFTSSFIQALSRSEFRSEPAGSTSGLSGTSAWPTSTDAASATASLQSTEATRRSRRSTGCSKWQISWPKPRNQAGRHPSASSPFSFLDRSSNGCKPDSGIVIPNIQTVAHFLLIYDRKACA
jgi:hypothetical protein